jgi:hypothetical protein
LIAELFQQKLEFQQSISNHEPAASLSVNFKPMKINFKLPTCLKKEENENEPAASLSFAGRIFDWLGNSSN